MFLLTYGTYLILSPNSKKDNKDTKIFDENKNRFFSEIIEYVLEETPSSLISIIGISGAGKTTTFLGIANQTKVSKNFIPHFLHIEDNLTLIQSIKRNIANSKVDFEDLLSLSNSIFFFIEGNNIKKDNQEKIFKEIIKFKELLDKINANFEKKHRLFFLYRTQSTDTSPDNISQKLRNHSLTLELNPLNKEVSLNYIKRITGVPFKTNITSEISSLINTPLFVDFFNWLSIETEFNILGNIDIGNEAKLYIIFTREYLRREFKNNTNSTIFKVSRNVSKAQKLLSSDEIEFARYYNNNNLYFLEPQLNPIEMFLMILAKEFESTFLETDMFEKINKLFEESEYPWIK